MSKPDPDPSYCIICGFDLSRTEAPRCPECGSPFDPNRRTTTSESPHLVMRLLQHTLRLQAWFVERYCSLHCRACGHPFSPGDRGRCPECNGSFDTRDPNSITCTIRGMPRLLLRVQHVAPVRGLVLPIIALVLALRVSQTGSTLLPAISRYGFVTLHDLPALVMAGSWAGLAIALHAHYFWGRIEHCWRFAALPAAIGLTAFVGGWLYALGRAVIHALF